MMSDLAGPSFSPVALPSLLLGLPTARGAATAASHTAEARHKLPDVTGVMARPHAGHRSRGQWCQACSETCPATLPKYAVCSVPLEAFCPEPAGPVTLNPLGRMWAFPPSFARERSTWPLEARPPGPMVACRVRLSHCRS